MEAMGALSSVYGSHNFHSLFFKPIFQHMLDLIKDADENVEEQKAAAASLIEVVALQMDLPRIENFEQNMLEYLEYLKQYLACNNLAPVNEICLQFHKVEEMHEKNLEDMPSSVSSAWRTLKNTFLKKDEVLRKNPRYHRNYLDSISNMI